MNLLTMTKTESNDRRFLLDLFAEQRPERLRSYFEWVQDELIIPDGPYKGMRFKAERQPYTRLLMSEMGKWRRHVITGPTQSGKSLSSFVGPIMWHLFERGENVICGVPSGDMVKNKWLNDIKPAIDASRYRNLLPKKGAGSQGGTPSEIHFLNGATLMFMTGGGGDKGRAGATAPVVVITETDGMDEIGGTSRESDKITQLEVRTNAYQSVGTDRIYMECTVSIDEGRTWQEYINSTASKIMCQCPHCGVWVCPERENLVGWQGAESKLEAGRNAAFACLDCGEVWTEKQRLEMNENAVLLHSGQELEPYGKFFIGSAVDTDTFGGRWNAFNNMFTTAQRLGEMEWEAERAEDSDAAQLKMKQFIWALPAEDQSTEKIPLDVAIVRGSDRRYKGRCSGIPRGEVPFGSNPITCFIDISMRVLQWSIEVKVDQRIHVVDYGFYETPHPEVIGDEAAIEAALHELCPKIDEHYPDLKLGLIDCGNWREKILDIIPSLSKKWMPSHGLPRYAHPENKNGKVQAGKIRIPVDGNRHYHLAKDDSGLWVVNFDPDTLKHRVHSGFLIKPDTEYGFARGCITLPGNDPLEHNEYARQVTAEEFRSVFKEGKGAKTEWFKIRRHNHMLDGCVGNMVARMVVATDEIMRRSTPQRKYGVISKQ